MSILKFLKFIVLAGLLVAMATSCNKDEEPTEQGENAVKTSIRSLMDDDSPSTNDNSMNNNEANDEECFTIVFPLDITFPNGSTLTMNNEEELEEAVDAYYDANPDAEKDPSPVFPISVLLADGSQSDISNDEEFEDLLIMCDEYYEYDEDDILICFDIDYPITLIFADGNTLVVNDDDELKKAITDWEAANLEEEEPTVDYPINITLEDGTVVIITSDDELEEVFDSCYEDYDCDEDGDHEDDDDEDGEDDKNDDDNDNDDDDDDDECFDLDFPLSVSFGDDTQTVSDYDELDKVLEAWETAFPDSNNEPMLTYPISITYDDGEQQDIASEEELDAAYDSCED